MGRGLEEEGDRQSIGEEMNALQSLGLLVAALALLVAVGSAKGLIRFGSSKDELDRDDWDDDE